MIVFYIEKIFRGWSFWSVTKTSPLFYSYFFFPLVEVGLIELVVLLAALLVGGIEEVGGKEEEEEVVEEGGGNDKEE